MTPNKYRSALLKSLYLLTISAFLISGCSSINRISELKSAHFPLGATSKVVVVDTVGLPNYVVRQNQKEYWVYSGRESQRQFIVPAPVQSGAGTMIEDMGTTHAINYETNYVFIFNAEDSLVESFKPTDKE